MNETILTLLSDYIYFMNMVFIITIIFVERKKPMYTLFWITILIFTSYVGFVIYLMFGLSFRKKRITKKFYRRNLFRDLTTDDNKGIKNIGNWSHLINYFQVIGRSRLTFSNNVKVYTQGRELFDDIKKDIKEAKNFIHLEYFVFEWDTLGREILDLLVTKAKNGVEVRLIIDGVGSRSITKKTIKELKRNGVEVAVFFPLYLPSIHLRVNYRTHRKILIIDGHFGYMGGFNVGDSYLGKGSLGYWRDTHVRLEGESVIELQKEFFSSWAFTRKQLLFNSASKDSLDLDLDKYFPKLKKSNSYRCPIQVVGSAPDYDFRLIRDGFLKIISSAKKYIYIHTPYFIPDDSTYEALKFAALSGVTVKIIVPNKPDHMMVYWASLSYIGELLNFGVDFYTYNNGFLHSKMIISDDNIATVGSSNFDHRSFYHNFEINSFFYDDIVVKNLKKTFIEDLKVSTKLSNENYKKRPISIKLKESISRLFSPIL